MVAEAENELLHDPVDEVGATGANILGEPETEAPLIPREFVRRRLQQHLFRESVRTVLQQFAIDDGNNNYNNPLIEADNEIDQEDYE